MTVYPTHRPTPEIICDVCDSFVVGEVHSFKDSLVCGQCYTDLTRNEQRTVRQMPNVSWPALVSISVLATAGVFFVDFWPLVQMLSLLLVLGAAALASLKVYGGLRG